MRKWIGSKMDEAAAALACWSHDRRIILLSVAGVALLCSSGARAQGAGGDVSVFSMVGTFTWWLSFLCYVLAVVFFIKAGYDWTHGQTASAGLCAAGAIIMILAPHIAKSMFVSGGILQDGDNVTPQRPSSVK